MIPEVKFNLKKPNSKEETIIFLVFRYKCPKTKKDKFVYSIGEKILPRFWNSDKQRVAQKRDFPQYPEMNQYLDNLENFTKDTYRKFRNEQKKIPTFEELKNELDLFTARKEKAPQMTFIRSIEQFIDRKKSDPQAKLQSLKTYVKVLNHLKKFEQTKYKRILDFADIDVDFAEGFKKYLYEQDSINSPNYVAKVFKFLRQFMNDAMKQGYHSNTMFQNDAFQFSEKEADAIYLNLNELSILETFDFSQFPALDNVRDWFLIGCFTGLRFEDLISLKKEHLQTITYDNEPFEVIQRLTQKTEEEVIIPIHNVIKTILDKHKGEFPRAISNQKFNENIKRACEMAGITENILHIEYEKGVPKEKNIPKYKQVKTHTMRRSFVTNMTLSGAFNNNEIKLITAHKSDREFSKYNRTSKIENAVNVAKKLNA